MRMVCVFLQCVWTVWRYGDLIVVSGAGGGGGGGVGGVTSAAHRMARMQWGCGTEDEMTGRRWLGYGRYMGNTWDAAWDVWYSVMFVGLTGVSSVERRARSHYASKL